MANEFRSFLASGTVNPSRFVNIVDGSAGYVEQGTATKTIIGVSAEGQQDPSYAGDSASDAATTGQALRVYGPGRSCLVRAGGTISAGRPLTADASGQAVTADLTATGHVRIGGYALENGASGDLINIMVWPFEGRQA